MELFVPGLIILIIAGFYVFLVLPRMGPMVLVCVSLFALIAAGINHYSMFYSEYALSTWQYTLAAYTPWVILGLALITMIGVILFMFTGGAAAKALNAVPTPMEALQQSVNNSVTTMPSANTATNPVTAALNTFVTNASNTAKNTRSPAVPGLGYPASSV
jgi:hypothetical protein